MPANDPLARVLDRLLRDRTVASSSVGKRARVQLQPLFATGALVEERQGGGQRIRVAHTSPVEAFVDALYPSGLAPIDEGAPARARAVRSRRDSKSGGALEESAVLVRGFDSRSRLRVQGRELDLAEWTMLAGAAGVVFGGGAAPELLGRVAIVENREFFLHIERTPVGCEVALLGRPSRALLAWLASPAMRGADYIYCGDYDPTGLSDYINVRDACPDRTTLFLPDRLEELMRRFGNAALVEKSQQMLPRLRRESDPAVREVVELMDRFGVGLEQEVLIAPLGQST